MKNDYDVALVLKSQPEPIPLRDLTYDERKLLIALLEEQQRGAPKSIAEQRDHFRRLKRDQVRRYRAKHREKHRAYMREYMRKRRAKKPA